MNRHRLKGYRAEGGLWENVGSKKGTAKPNGEKNMETYNSET